MSWFDVLKVVLPKDEAMEYLEQRYGLKFTKRPFSTKNKKVEYVLEGNGIKIILRQSGVGFEQIVVYIDTFNEGRPKRFEQEIALSKKLELVKAHIDANYTKKSAGAVTSTSPAVHNVRYSPKKEEEDE